MKKKKRKSKIQKTFLRNQKICKVQKDHKNETN